MYHHAIITTAVIVPTTKTTNSSIDCQEKLKQTLKQYFVFVVVNNCWHWLNYFLFFINRFFFQDMNGIIYHLIYKNIETVIITWLLSMTEV